MAKLETWISPVKKINEEVKVVVSDRFVDPETGKPAEWTLTPLNADRTEAIQESCMIQTTHPKTGAFVKQLDTLKYINGLIAETVTDPNFRDPDIQEFYGTKGSAVKTMNTMLSPNEKDVLTREVTKIYRVNGLDDMVEDAKNE